ncbi:MAG: hypothetical protein KDA31_02570 [Phycisphaerales bacterium]|nr:hypothetical protein [Phycisphaerales bacterium]MCB9837020.1 hypothetical protein [Phycisphaera sp.]
MSRFCFVLAASVLMAPTALAQVVSYDNSDGTFVWTPWLTYPDGFVVLDERSLDITLSPGDNQAGLADAERAITTDYNYPLTSSEIWLNHARDAFPSGLAEVAAGSAVNTGFASGFRARAFSASDDVGSSETFINNAAIATHPIGGPEPLLGDHATIGVRFPTDETATSFHYGYIVLEWRDSLVFNNNKGGTSTLDLYQPVAWAYETTPDTPITIPSETCLADTNGDGDVTPADFSAWVAAFNAMAPECDQNQDGMCSPADFSAWVANYNTGC